MSCVRTLLVIAVLALAGNAIAGKDSVMAPKRNNAQNFKDRALSICVAQAYAGTPAGEDAIATQSAFLEWTYYDDAKGNPAVDALIDEYLQRDYSNPFEGYKNAQFALLKCLDLYHSPALEALVRKHVPHPTWNGNKPPAKR